MAQHDEYEDKFRALGEKLDEIGDTAGTGKLDLKAAAVRQRAYSAAVTAYGQAAKQRAFAESRRTAAMRVTTQAAVKNGTKKHAQNPRA